MTPRLECAGLTGGRGATTAFRDVDLTVNAGQVLALIGPNGAGKSTLLLTAAGLLRAQRGTVRVDGRTMPAGRPATTNKAGLVLVPDNRSLFTSLSVEDNLAAAARRGGPRPGDILREFPALDRRSRVRAGALSGGEQQMLAIARALIQQPKCLLIDEMSMGLAPLIVQDLFAMVRRIADDHGCAVVLVEQHVHLALQVADQAAVLKRGSLVLQGAAGELLADPDRLERAYFGSGAPSAPAR